jgi:hypothetical protein
LTAKYLHPLFSMLLCGGFVYFSQFIYFSHLFMNSHPSVWTHGYLFYTLL